MGANPIRPIGGSAGSNQSGAGRNGAMGLEPDRSVDLGREDRRCSELARQIEAGLAVEVLVAGRRGDVPRYGQ